MKISFAFRTRLYFSKNKNILFAMQLLIFVKYLRLQILPVCSISFTIWLLCNQVLLIFASCFPSQQSRFQLGIITHTPFGLVGSNGLGPSTSRLSGVCSNQLSYEPIYGGGNRVRTDDPLLAGQVLYQLSYTPISSRSSQNKCPPYSREATLLKTNKKETIEFPID